MTEQELQRIVSRESNSSDEGAGGGFGASPTVPAGNFSEWLHTTEKSLQSGKGRAEVPCGTCRGCCRSSMFIHIEPVESGTLRRIPRGLHIPAPGRPKGHRLMGYDQQGRCPMLRDQECSIYEDRPQTCRDYDCRIFAATGIPVDRQGQAEIADRVRAWAFEYESRESREEQRLLRQAADFLRTRGDLFPPGSLPANPVRLAVLAVRIFRRFGEFVESGQDGCSMAEAILRAMGKTS